MWARHAAVHTCDAAWEQAACTAPALSATLPRVARSETSNMASYAATQPAVDTIVWLEEEKQLGVFPNGGTHALVTCSLPLHSTSGPSLAQPCTQKARQKPSRPRVEWALPTVRCL